MKTEPTEAIKYIQQSTSKEDHHTRVNSILACTVAFKEGQSSPKIKQLEWREHDLYWKAITSFIDYKITRNFYQRRLSGFAISCSLKIFETLDEAKQACQEDYERRVKECFEL